MRWLNYHHLLYFWMVAREGSIVRASRELRLAHPTISSQIHRLEGALGQKLFVRRGRQLALTEVGRVAYRFADEIFSLGREFLDTMEGRGLHRPEPLIVGLADVVPKSIVHLITEPVFRLHPHVRVQFREDKSVAEFLGEMVTYAVDVVLSDRPLVEEGPVRVFNHLLGQTGTIFLADARLAASCRRGFPRSLDGASFILPGPGSQLRRDLDRWLDAKDVRVRAVAEVDDTSLSMVLSEAGLGVFAVPASIESEVLRRYGLQVLGRADDLVQRFYAVSVERKISNPAVLAIVEVARDILGAPETTASPVKAEPRARRSPMHRGASKPASPRARPRSPKSRA